MFETMKTELRLANVSKNTIDAYVYQNKRFLEYTKKKPHQVKTSDVKEYLINMYAKNNSPRTMRLVISSLNYYYTKLMRRNIMKYIQKPKLPDQLPRILEREEIKKMIKTTSNPKHRLLIILMYSSGVRVGEAIKIRHEDINTARKLLFVRAGKGRKDRYTILSEVFLEEYNLIKKSGEWLFSGRNNNHLARRSAQLVIEIAAIRAGIKRRVHSHMLRSSFATHLIDDNIELLHVSKLLGHSDLNTTRNAYIRSKTKHYENITSPIDV
ncbi:tyrosine-type recombinase/integrase [Candidatus Woesearchaeota archaeon]|nr:tyrosine-type recombinase/integrase [Candidatus Woesearchaeota archaeon]